MNLLENIRESLRSIRGNRLRTVLTSMIIAIGISALVGILTAIDGIQNSVNQSFAGLGYNSFDIRNRDVMKRRKQGEKEKTYPSINYHQSKKYKEVFGKQATVGMKTNVTFSGEVKYASKKTPIHE
jgi:putative ABC transport system permease protein